MIPKDKDLMIRRIIFLAEGKEGSQCFPVAHIGLRESVRLFQFTVPVDIATNMLRTDATVVPSSGASRLNDYHDVIR